MVTIKVDEDIELRMLQQKDRDLLFTTVNDNRSHLRRWLPWVDYVTGPNDYIQVIKSWQEEIDSGNGLELAIFHNEEFVGMCGYNFIAPLSRRAQIGYWIAGGHEGKGIVRRSVQGLIDYGFNQMELNRIEIICGIYNYRSRAVPESLGFVKEGVMADYEFLYDHFHDCVLYRKLKKEYDKEELE